MSLYDMLKDCITVAKKANNLPLVEKLVDAQIQILDLVNENDRLKRENQNLKDNEERLKDIERHVDPYITLKSDTEKIIYCSCCFDKDKKLIQVQANDDGRYVCPACKYVGYYDKNEYNSIIRGINDNKTII